ncbi:MAG: C39 family peptidase [Gammaproteobacteria bacterium]|nr:C39 family peptidase [Gammaproteobacteria bacterium]
MTYSVRFASPEVDYPLPVAGTAPWRLGTAHAIIDLPDIPADHIIAAGFASTSTRQRFALQLRCNSGRFQTAAFGHRAKALMRSRGRGVGVPVDYFDTSDDLTSVRLCLKCRARAPAVYLLTVSIRPRIIEAPTTVPVDTPVLGAPCLSQTTLDAAISRQACSPTATAMALGIADDAEFRAFVQSAMHRPTGLCGVWPQNLWAAARRGRLGGVELMSSWEDVRQALSAQVPVVASVRFQTGELPNSPMPATGGHLVLLRGIEGGTVRVNDPAGPPGAVDRRYDARAFAAAWMRERGAAYVFAGTGSRSSRGAGAPA